MASRTVMKVNLECYKCRRVALQSITQIEGIDMISYNKKEQTITVEGDADPVCIANQLKRKFKCATITSVGPPPKPSPPPTKPPEGNPKTKTDKKKNAEDPSKKNRKKNENDKPKLTPPPPKPVDPPPPCIIPVPTPYIMSYGPCKPVQPCCCLDCSSGWGIPRPGCHPPQPHTEVYYVYNEENPNPCTIS